MYCLDANIIISALRGDVELKKRISSIEPEGIFISSITLCELFRGAYKTSNPENTLFLIHSLIGNYTTLSFDEKCAEIFGKDFNKLEKMGKPTQIFDLMLASVAKRNGLIVVTRNRKHFENIEYLKIEEW